MKLKIEIDRVDTYSAADVRIWLTEIVNTIGPTRLQPDVRTPIRDFAGREIGYWVIESPIDWGPPLTMEDM